MTRGINNTRLRLSLFSCIFKPLLVPLPGQENSSNYEPANPEKKANRDEQEREREKEGRIGWKRKEKLVQVEVEKGSIQIRIINIPRDDDGIVILAS